MKATKFSEKHPSELINATFDFTNDLGSTETITTAAVTIRVLKGTDASPSSILVGSPSVVTPANKMIVQPLQNGVEFVDYLLTALVNTSAGRKLVLQAILPVRRAVS